MINPEVRQAVTLAQQGDKSQAQELLKQALKRDPEDVDAWVVLAQVVDNHDEAVSYMKRAVKLRPDDERSRRYLDYLLQQEQAAPVEAPGPSNQLIIGLAVVAVLLCVGMALAYAFLRPGAQAETANTGADCQALIEQALLLSNNGCRNLGRNEVCYGHSAIKAELAPGANDQFDKTGDVVQLDILSKFIASPLDLEKEEWGIGIFNVEANVPGSLPGQTVTLLIFGSSVDNDSGDMRAFYFSSGLGSIVCENVPFNGILVRMADGTGMSFRANGADITLMGTGLMEAQTGNKMTVSMLDGTAKVSANGQEQVFGPGQQVSVPLTGLDASGPPSSPATVVDDMLTIACILTGFGCPGTVIPTISAADIAGTQGVPPPGPTAVAQVTSRPTATQRPGEPTWTPAPTNTQRPGEPTRTPAPTNTQRPGEPTWTPAPTQRPGEPTRVPAPTATTKPPSIPPTSAPPTAVPPTAVPPTTPPPTTPPPTTPPPTTPPPTVAPCMLSWVGVASGPKTVTFKIENHTGGVITLTNITNVSWPTSTNALKNVKLGTSLIWNGTAFPNSPIIPDKGIRTIPDGGTPDLVFTFQPDVDSSGYSVSVVFDIGCPLTAGG